MSGVVVAVVGASGAGKDSLISYARQRLAEAGVVFVRRVVTRASDADSEDHDSLEPEAFDAAERAGRFALSWHAHGLRYGLPIALDRDFSQGRVIVANLSRAALPALARRYPGVVVVEVSAAPAIVARRLAQRGRESGAGVEARLARAAPAPLPEGAVRLDNSGELAVAGENFVALLENLLALRQHA